MGGRTTLNLVHSFQVLFVTCNGCGIESIALSLSLRRVNCSCHLSNGFIAANYGKIFITDKDAVFAKQEEKMPGELIQLQRKIVPLNVDKA